MVGPGHASIILADRLVDPTERRWAVAHELGHYVLGHPAPPPETLFGPRPRRVSWDLPDDEDEADCFAFAVLTPERTVETFCDTRPMTLRPPLLLARACGVSLETGAIRVAESTCRACAVVLSRREGIVWIAPARQFLHTFGKALVPDQRLDPRSVAARYFGAAPVPDRPVVVPSAAWFVAAPGEPPILEHSLPGTEPGTVLTMLWAPCWGVPRQRVPPHARAVTYAP
ncbi:MAG: ImmA/IrrE family metallo-endopeptidase [bacterium]